MPLRPGGHERQRLGVDRKPESAVPLRSEPTIGANLDADALWVIRGGHFGDDARLVRTTARGAAEPGARRAFIGFRVALVPPAR